MSLFVRADVLRLMGMRHAEERGDVPVGPLGSLGKVAGAELNQRIYDLCIDVLGMEGTMSPSYAGVESAVRATTPWSFLRSRANTIEGGTAEVLRNVIAERVLGLPGDVRVDKDVPWKEVARG